MIILTKETGIHNAYYLVKCRSRHSKVHGAACAFLEPPAGAGIFLVTDEHLDWGPLNKKHIRRKQHLVFGDLNHSHLSIRNCWV